MFINWKNDVNGDLTIKKTNGYRHAATTVWILLPSMTFTTYLSPSFSRIPKKIMKRSNPQPKSALNSPINPEAVENLFDTSKYSLINQ